MSARCILLLYGASRQRSQQSWAARGKVGRGPRNYLRREITPPSSATEGAHICARHPEPLVVRDATKRTTKFDKL